MEEVSREHFDNRITIAIPVYNRYFYFEEAINSVLAQNVEANIIVVDNNSDHNKFEKFINELKNPSVKYFKNKSNVGMVENWNMCIENCETEWLSILHDDDWISPDYVQEISKMIVNFPEKKLFSVRCVCDNKIVQSNFASSKLPKYYKVKKSALFYRNLSPFPGICIKLSFAKKIGSFNQTLFPSADYDYWIRCLFFDTIIHNDLPLAFYRISEDQTTTLVRREIIDRTFEIRKIYYNKKFFLSVLMNHFTLYELYKSYFKKITRKDIIEFENNSIQSFFILFYFVDKINMSFLFKSVLILKLKLTVAYLKEKTI
jgi:glycosyltransferase involved in cell wall biosynthesis